MRSTTRLTLDEARKLTQPTLTYQQTGELLGCDRRTVSAAAKAGTLPVIRIGRRVVVVRERLLAMLSAEGVA